jgi:hypothetical protein
VVSVAVATGKAVQWRANLSAHLPRGPAPAMEHDHFMRRYNRHAAREQGIDMWELCRTAGALTTA